MVKPSPCFGECHRSRSGVDWSGWEDVLLSSSKLGSGVVYVMGTKMGKTRRGVRSSEMTWGCAGGQLVVGAGM